MSKKRYIDTKFWSDGYIDDLDPTEKLLFLYLLTNERTNVAGVYELSLKIMSVETGIEKEMVDKILTRFVKDNKIVRHEKWIRVVNALNHQNTNNMKIQIGIDNVYSRIPNVVKQGLGMGDDESYMRDTRLSINSDSDSNSNSDPNSDLDLDLDSNSNSNSNSITASPSAKAVGGKDRRRVDDPVGSEYFRTCRELQLPMRNVTVIKGFIVKLENEIGREKALSYLSFIEKSYPNIPDDGYKPKLNDGSEIYSKRRNIQSWVERMRDRYNRPAEIGGRPIL